MAQLGLIAPPLAMHNSQSFTLHKPTLLCYFRPTTQQHKIKSFDHVKTLGFNCHKLSNMGLGFYSLHKTRQLGGFRPRNDKHSFSSVNQEGSLTTGNREDSFQFGDPVKPLDFNGHKHGRIELGFCEVSRRSRNYAVRSKSLLSVDEVVEREGSGGRVGEQCNYDAIVIGSGIGGLVAGTQLAVKGARVLVLEKYVIPGGSSGFYQRDGYTFDVGSSVMFGFSDKQSFISFFYL